MLEHEERGSGSIIVGRSARNQRIERLQRNLISGCISFLYCLFYFLEEHNLFHMHSAKDLYAFPFVFHSTAAELF